MKPSTLVSLLAVPALALAQSNTTTAAASTTSAASSGSAAASVQLSTSVSTSVGVDGNHQATTSLITTVISITAQPATTGTSNLSTNGTTASGNATSTSSTSQSPLPTATQSVDGGGNGPNGAPSPGASSSTGQFGPDDNHIAAALSLSANTVFTILAGAVAGAFLVLS